MELFFAILLSLMRGAVFWVVGVREGLAGRFSGT